MDAAGVGAVRAYWNEHIHDLQVAREPVGTPGFFAELDAYRFEKLAYLPQLIDFNGYSQENLLEIGCGVGIDLARFSRGGAIVTGVDLAPTSIELAHTYFDSLGLVADLRVMDGERLEFPDATFDVVYAHGVLQYTPNPQRMISEAYRVLRPNGRAVFMVYNRRSWLRLVFQFQT